MQKNKKLNKQEIISMEEYLSKRKIIREKENRKEMSRVIEEGPAFVLAGLYN